MQLSRNWVDDALRSAGKTRADLMRAWDVSQSNVSRFIAGHSEDLTLTKAAALCRLIGWDMDKLARAMGHDVPSSPSPPPAAPRAPGWQFSTRDDGKVDVDVRMTIHADAAAPLNKAVIEALLHKP